VNELEEVKYQGMTRTVNKRKKTEYAVLWFDIYQYIASRTTRRAKAALGKRTLRTFIEAKRKCILDNKFPDITISMSFEAQNAIPIPVHMYVSISRECS
jgi:hypothetical protein